MPVPVDLTNYKSISVEPLDGIKKSAGYSESRVLVTDSGK